MTRSRDIADQQDNLGGAVAPYVSGKNIIINGGFDVWQRGTTFTSPGANTYSADRWTIGDNTSCVYSRQSSGAPTGFQYYFRANRISGSTATGNINLVQGVETINSIPFAGKTVTFSLYARAGANGPSVLNMALYYGTGTDLTLWTGGGAGAVTIAGQAVTTSWARYTFTGTVPSNATQLFVWVYYAPTGTAGANEYFDVTGVQVELGSQATPFARAGGSIGGELALCQRYYYRVTATQAYSDFASGYNPSSSEGAYMVPFPVQMRTTPTALEQTGVASNYNILHSSGGGAARSVCNSVPTYQVASQNAARVYFIVPGGSLTAGQGSVGGSSNNTVAYLGWSAEL